MTIEDYYYSKKLDQYFPTRLDFLLYAHDGRGLGHVSRTVAVGLALKRLDPGAKVLVISGSAQTGILVGPGPLDWIKLPSYQTVLQDGVATGGYGDSGYYKSVLGKLRSRMIASLVSILRPRCVLADHDPAGKRQELLEALDQSREDETHWVLGIRGIVGENPDFWSDRTAAAAARYHAIVWYGDSRVLGTGQLDRLAGHFGRGIEEMGYVSRLLELKPFFPGSTQPGEAHVACTISAPWLGESGDDLLAAVKGAVESLDHDGREYHFYVSAADAAGVKQLFGDLPQCRVRPLSDRYFVSLLQSHSALIYGGYNSLLDVAAAGLPAVIVLRSTRDREQLEHLEKLKGSAGKNWQVIADEELGVDTVTDGLTAVMNTGPVQAAGLRFDGAERTARFLLDLAAQKD